MIGGRLLVHGDLLADDFAFQRDFRLGKGRVPDHVGQDVGEDRHQVGLAAAFVNGLILGSAGIELATRVFDFKAQFARAAALGAFEDHVFHEMGEACWVLGFIAAACRNVDGECGALGIGDSGYRQARPVGDLTPFVKGFAHDKRADASARSAGVVILWFG